MKKKLLFIVGFLFFINQATFTQNVLENKYDVKEYILDLQISNASTLISGNVIINANVTVGSLDTFVVDLIDSIYVSTYMKVDSVFVNGTPAAFQHHDDLIFVPLITPIAQNQNFSVQIYYHGNGNSQLYGNGISKYTYAGVSQTSTWSETNWAKIWWPSKQVLADKADSVTFYITTEATNKTGSNGVLKSTAPLPGGKVKYKWQTKHPIDFYLISFVVGPMTENITYASLPNSGDTVLLQSLLYPGSSYYPTHLKAINKTKQLMYLYSDLLGTYPFKDEKYGYCVIGTPLGAMEHQTMCSIGYQAMDTTFGVNYWWIAHEFGHQWFGDYVTCAKWNYIWLNEGLASYMEYLALQNIESQNRADTWIRNAHYNVLLLPGGSVYIPDALVAYEGNIFDYRLTYKKGPSILHILRYEINNDSLFMAVLKNYLSTYANSVATAENFKSIAEATTGMNFTDFFNQWYFGEGYPIFNIRTNQVNDTLIITSSQTTSTSVTPLFKTHFDLKINYLNGDSLMRLYQATNNETFKIYFPKTVTSVTFDPKYWLIQKSYVNTGIIEKNPPAAIEIKPNPANDYVIIECKNNEESFFEITDISGRIICKEQPFINNVYIDLSVYKSGIYFVKVRSGKIITTKKLVKIQ